MIQVINMRFALGRRAIIQDINLSFQRREVNMILGPNGAGKSTLLKCLSGTTRPSEGDIVLDGRSLFDYDITELAKRRAMLTQGSSINFPFTVREIVLMGRNPFSDKHSGAKDADIVDHALAAMDADDLKDRIFPTLSGGEQQRVQLARVFAQVWEAEDVILILDEPTSMLDLKHQHRLLRQVRTMVATKGWMVFVVIHDLHLAKMYGDVAILMKRGDVVLNDKVENALVAENISEVFEISRELVAV